MKKIIILLMLFSIHAYAETKVHKFADDLNFEHETVKELSSIGLNDVPKSQLRFSINEENSP